MLRADGKTELLTALFFLFTVGTYCSRFVLTRERPTEFNAEQTSGFDVPFRAKMFITRNEEDRIYL